MKQKIYVNKIDWIEFSKLLVGLIFLIGMPLYIINGVDFNNLFERCFSLGLAFVFYLIMFGLFSGLKIPKRKVYLKNAVVEK